MLLVAELYTPFFLKFRKLRKIYIKKWIYLIDLNLTITEITKELLHIKTPIILSSTLNSPLKGPEKIIKMAKMINCNIYNVHVNYKKYLDDVNLFGQENIRLDYSTYNYPVYKQQYNNFIANLSIIDLLFNEGPSCINKI